MTIEVAGLSASAGQLITLRADLSVAPDFGTVADEAAMVALSTATPGSTCYRTDTLGVWVLKVASYSSAVNWQQIGSGVGGGGSSTSVTTTTVSTSPYTVLVTDFGKVLDCVSGSATTITIPTDATGAFPAVAGSNNVFAIRQRGAGAITLPTTGGGVTVNNPQGLSLVQNGPEILFTEVAANTWNVS